MFLVLLALSIGAGVTHAAATKDHAPGRKSELLLVWLLAGYCGIPMLVVSLGALASPERAAAVLGFPADNPFQAFLSWAYLGMSLVALLSVRYRGPYLIAPALLWAIFFAGATSIHFHGGAEGGHTGVWGMFATHGLVSLTLIASLALSGAWRMRSS